MVTFLPGAQSTPLRRCLPGEGPGVPSDKSLVGSDSDRLSKNESRKAEATVGCLWVYIWVAAALYALAQIQPVCAALN